MDLNVQKDFDRLKENVSFLRYLHDAKLQQQKQLLKSASRKELEAVCECAFNILRKNVPLEPRHVEQLRKTRNRRLVYKLVDKRIPLEEKRRMLVQSGGFPFALLAPIIGGLISAFT